MSLWIIGEHSLENLQAEMRLPIRQRLRSLAALGWLIATSVFTLGAATATILPVRFPTFAEHFASEVKTSASGVLVGLAIGDLEGKFDLESLRLALPQLEAPYVACVEGNTEDGQYWFRGEFDVPQGPADLGRLFVPNNARKLNPEQIAAVAQYNLWELGLTARLKSSCDSDEVGVLVPAVLGKNVSSTLTIVVNSGHSPRVSAELFVLGGKPPLASEVCIDSSGFQLGQPSATPSAHGSGPMRTTAFDSICQLKLSHDMKKGLYSLDIILLTEEGDTIPARYRVSLDPRWWRTG